MGLHLLNKALAGLSLSLCLSVSLASTFLCSLSFYFCLLLFPHFSPFTFSKFFLLPHPGGAGLEQHFKAVGYFGVTQKARTCRERHVMYTWKETRKILSLPLFHLHEAYQSCIIQDTCLSFSWHIVSCTWCTFSIMCVYSWLIEILIGLWTYLRHRNTSRS